MNMSARRSLRFRLTAIAAVFGAALFSKFDPSRGGGSNFSAWFIHPIEFTTYIGNSGDQSAIDACIGGLTYHSEISQYIGKPYFPIHEFCGGEPIMRLSYGDSVIIEQLGEFKVISMLDVDQGDTARVLQELPGEVYLQTCHQNDIQMRVIGLAKAASV